VTLVVCSPAGRMLGTLPAFDVSSPWWPDVAPVVAGARERFGVDLTVLRVLRTTGRGPDGGEGAYLAETADAGSADVAQPDDGLRRLAEADDSRRQPWARPGGPAADIAWADAELAAAGLPRIGPAMQVKSWNLSSVLRLPTPAGPIWCKHVPAFLGHEGALLAAVHSAAPDLVPAVLAHRRDPDGTSVTLLEHVPGDEQWHAPEPVLAAMARRWVAAQARWPSAVDELLALGLPDGRSDALVAAEADLLDRRDVRGTLTPGELDRIDALVAALPGRLAELDACGLPATLVHGDLHPGNWIGDGSRLVLVDWGDSLVGHPMLDVLAFLQRTPAGAVRDHVRRVFVESWRAAAPRSDPDRAMSLIEPVEAVRRALVYRTFLDGIEETERDYHEADVPAMLRLALGAEESSE
jgi:aminoglycoside phosphotransferase (APT) family kinase protein